MTPTNREPFTIGVLHPHMVRPATSLLGAVVAYRFGLEGRQCCFRAFEGFRHPQRQYELFARGKVTKAGPWQSAHQYGLAMDFACRWIDQGDTLGDWHWPDAAPWDWLKREARRHGLDVPIEWDRGHVEHPIWRQYQMLNRAQIEV